MMAAAPEYNRPVVCIVGPTASGKSEVAQLVCEELGGEVVSVDSMQVYRGMDIGTGKVPEAERRVPHFGLDLVDPGEPYSAALFQEYARARFAEIDARSNYPVLCGGTGFYVRAAIDDYDFPAGEQVGNAVRDRYNALAREQGPQALWEVLAGRDAESARVIPPNDVKRVVRALELLEEGTTYAAQREALATLPQWCPAVIVGLAVEPAELVRRIDRRVEGMFEAGLVDEVKGLLEKGFREGITAPAAIGYRQVVAYLDGEISLDEAVEDTKACTRRYAKRQRTWFRKEARLHWLEATDYDAEALARDACSIVATMAR